MATPAPIRYRVSFRLLSPMQVGAGTHGMVEQTLLYVPGRLLWAAMTKAIAEELFDDYDPMNYRDVGEALRGNAADRFGTLFLSFDGSTPIVPTAVLPTKLAGNEHPCKAAGKHDADDDSQLWWWEKGGKGHFWSDSHFRSIVLSSEAAQSTDPERMATVEASLHEVMVILPRVRLPGNEQPHSTPVHLVGYFELPEPLQIGGKTVVVRSCANQPGQFSVEKDVLSRVRFGGGRTRGRGRVALVQLEQAPANGSLDYDEFRDSKWTYWRALRAIRLPGKGQASGRIVLASHREWRSGSSQHAGPGRGMNQVGLCWEPGAVFSKGAAGGPALGTTSEQGGAT